MLFGEWRSQYAISFAILSEANASQFFSPESLNELFYYSHLIECNIDISKKLIKKMKYPVNEITYFR